MESSSREGIQDDINPASEFLHTLGKIRST